MHHPDVLTVRVAAHPDPVVARFGFDLDHPYLERCWTSQLGPAAVVLLRRLSDALREAHPAHMGVAKLAGELGVQPAKMGRTIQRVTRYGFARLDLDDRALDVYATIPPLNDRQLDRAPAATVMAHHRFLDERFGHAAPTASAGLIQRLDRLQHVPATPVLER